MTTNFLTTSPTSLTLPTSGVGRAAAGVARIALGGTFFVFGLNGFVEFIPPPSELPPEPAMAFAVALMNTGYMMPLIKGTEVLVGALLLAKRWVPLALVLLAPLLLNIVAFHFALAPSGTEFSIVLSLLGLYLAWVHRRAYAPLFVSKT